MNTAVFAGRPFQNLFWPWQVVLAFFCFAVALADGPVVVAPSDDGTLTTISRVRKAISQRSGANYAIALHGTVLWVGPDQDQFILQDETGGISIKMSLRNSPSIQPGAAVQLAGHCQLTPQGEISTVLIDNDGTHASVEGFNSTYLSAGFHAFTVEWFNHFGDYALALDYAGPNIGRQPLSPAVLFHANSPTNVPLPGLEFQCYEGDWDYLPDFPRLPVVKRGIAARVDLSLRTRVDSAGLVFSGLFKAPRDGVYTFWLKSDDGSRMYFGDPVQLSVLGKTNFPAPRRLLADRSLAARPDLCWSEIQGVITQVRESYYGAEVELAAGTQPISLRVLGGNHEALKRWVRMPVTVAGIYQPAYDANGLAVATFLVPRPENIVRVNPANDSAVTSPSIGNQTDEIAFTNALQVKSLGRTDAPRHYPARLRGVITARSEKDFVIQDSTWSLFCYWDGAAGQQPKIGEYWEIEGVTDVGFAPDIVVHRTTYLAPGVLPEPLHPTRDELLNGSLDTQYIELQGVATAVETNAMTLLTRAGKIQFEDLALGNPAIFRGALVKIRGVCVPNRDTNQMIRATLSPLRLFSALVTVDQPAPAHPFGLGLRHPSDLLYYDAHADVLRRVKMAGLVTLERNGRYFLVDGQDGFRFEPAEPLHLQRGDMVEVVGFPDTSGPSPVLREAVVQVTGHASLPPPRELSEASVLSERWDANRVRVTSRLLRLTLDHDQEILELQIGTRNYLGRLANTNGVLPKILPGSLLQLTGVYAAEGSLRAGNGVIDSFNLLLDSPADIQVLARPSWWTFRHTLTVIGSLSVVIVAAFIWITQLRRQVEERSLQLASEIKLREQAEYQRALEAERTRIAQDLHDELGATLTEIRFLGAVSSRNAAVPETTRSQLREVSEKSHQLIASLDEMVWAVNPANDSLPNLANYMCHVTEEFFRASGVRCRFDVDQSLPPVTLTSEVRHNLYLVVREALNNVVKHSRATEAWLRIRWSEQSLRISVEDNGRGFVRQDDGRAGNGLSNMPRRMQKIGGLFAYESRLDHGTVCRIELPSSALEA